MKHFQLKFTVMACMIGLSQFAFTQIVGTAAFLQSSYLELVVNNESGIYLTNQTAPAGYHFPGVTLTKGMVADPGKDGWDEGSPALCGDYFAPGYPVEGFAIQIGSSVYFNDFLALENGIPGSLKNYHADGSGVSASWRGVISDESLVVRQLTKINTGASYAITHVILTNTGTEPLENIYYCRNTDPDQDADLGFSYTTNNIVVYNQPASDWALVTAEGLSLGCFLSLGSYSANARVAYGGFSMEELTPEQVWNGTGGHMNEGSVAGDQAISLAFWVPEILPGESKVFSFVYGTNYEDVFGSLELTTDEESSKIAASLNEGINSAPKADFTVSPNPGNGHMQFFATNISSTAAAHLQITNMLGEIVQEMELENTGKTITQNIDLENGLADGTYFITLLTGTEKIVHPFILNR